MTVKEAYKKITSSPELKKAAIEAVKNGKAPFPIVVRGLSKIRIPPALNITWAPPKASE